MLKIRKEQVEAFLPKTDEEIVEFIVKHLHEESPNLIERLPPESLREMVGNGVARARGHGLRRLEDLTAFVSIMFEIAPDFDEHEELRRVLRDDGVPADERMDRLFDSELDDAWEEVVRYRDPEARAGAWFPELKSGKD
ncbi:MAG: hypothetical protein H0X14_04790 [Acidobacteria bacterium]|nr:hypothetical protein [Acidobacteriota bacterium]